MHVRVDLDRVRANAKTAQEAIDGEVIGVVKGVAARREVVEAFLAAGIDRIALSRPAHLARYRGVDAELVMLRVPALSEIADVVAKADVTLHGSRTAVEAANEAAKRRDVTHEVVPMIDAGDGREGVPLADATEFVDAIERLDALRIREVGVNAGCFGDPPDPDAIARVVDEVPDYPVSVGGSGTYPLRERLPEAVSSYRLGDALLTGKFRDTPIDGLRRGAFQLWADVLASRVDEAVVDVGNVNSDPRHLVPAGDFAIDRWSNEMSVIDTRFEEGDLVPFEMEYDAIATTFNSRYL